MTIREIEERSGMTRANIRFYEQEGLLSPVRRENGYRDYSVEDLEVLKRIRLLRTLHISLEEIKALAGGSEELSAVLKRQIAELERHKEDAEQSRRVCIAMEKDGACYETLNAGRYLAALQKSVSEEKPGAQKEAAAAGSAGSVAAVPGSFGSAVTKADSTRAVLAGADSSRPAAAGADSPGPAAETVPELLADRIPRVRAPWRRFFARSLDLAIYTAVWELFLVLVARISLNSFSAWGVWLCSLLGLGMMLILEPVLLHFFGATAGKWLLGLSVWHYEDRRLTVAEARSRTFGVWLWGMGLGAVPIFNLVRYWKSYRACAEGDTLPWDADTVLVLKDERKWRVGVWIGLRAALFAALFLALTAAGQARYRGDITVSQFCDNYNRLSAFYSVETNRRLNPDGSWWEEPLPEGTVVIELGGGEDLPEPEFVFEEQAGSMTGMSFAVSYEDRDLWADSYQNKMALAVLSFVGARDGDWLFRRETDRLVTYIYEHPFESFQFTVNGVAVTCEVEYDGYMYPGASGILIPEEGREADNAFSLRFEMRRED